MTATNPASNARPVATQRQRPMQITAPRPPKFRSVGIPLLRLVPSRALASIPSLLVTARANRVAVLVGSCSVAATVTGVMLSSNSTEMREAVLINQPPTSLLSLLVQFLALGLQAAWFRGVPLHAPSPRLDPVDYSREIANFVGLFADQRGLLLLLLLLLLPRLLLK
jgi:hypothetical protein